jgi:RNA polymerase sigma factor (sigma-70 family)
MAGGQANLILRHLRAVVAGQTTAQLGDRQLLERFTTHHEEAAFDALVRRYGPLVLGVCRRVLRNSHDAEDAFQATFLILARKAGSLRRRDSIGAWLYRVASHTAMRARASAASRRRHERQVGPPVAADPLAEVTGRELLAVLDEELQRLPERYRAPLVLCYLQGQTRDEVARQLGCSLGTLKRRLEHGRARLRSRLDRRGLALPAALLAAGLSEAPAAAAVPVPLAAAAVQAALRGAAGPGMTAAGSAPVAALAAGVLHGLFVQKLKTAAAVLLAVGLLGAVGYGLSSQGDRPAPAAANPQPAPAAGPTPAATPGPVAEDQMTVTGRVFAPDGQAAAGIPVTLMALPKHRPGHPEPRAQVLGQAQSDPQGGFRFTVARTSSRTHSWVTVFSDAWPRGVGGSAVDPDALQPEAVVRLDPPQTLRGRLVDLQGNPAAGVPLRLVQVKGPLSGRDGFVAEPVTGGLRTDDQGWFTLGRLGRNWTVRLDVHDDRFARQTLEFETREPERPEAPTRSLAPAHVLMGQVTYADTGRPVAGARLVVEARQDGRYFNLAGASDGRTDADGRFRLLPYAGNFFTLFVHPPEGEPYLLLQKTVTVPRGERQQEVNLALQRGVLVRGKVTEAGSGKPVAGASVKVWQRDARDPVLLPGMIDRKMVASGPDGVFQVVVPPMPGELLVKGPTADYLHRGIGPIQAEFVAASGLPFYPDRVVPVDLQPGVPPPDVAVTLHRGVTVRGRVEGPDGRPVARALLVARGYLPLGTYFYHDSVQPVREGRFELPGCDPRKTHRVYCLDAEHRLGAVVDLPGRPEEDGEPAPVRLAPCGAAVVRLIDPQGRPLANFLVNQDRRLLALNLLATAAWPFDSGKGISQAEPLHPLRLETTLHWALPDKDLRTDARGRLTFAPLIPGARYRLNIWEGNDDRLEKEFKVTAGQTLDLPDITLKQP